MYAAYTENIGSQYANKSIPAAQQANMLQILVNASVEYAKRKAVRMTREEAARKRKEAREARVKASDKFAGQEAVRISREKRRRQEGKHGKREARGKRGAGKEKRGKREARIKKGRGEREAREAMQIPNMSS